MDHYGYWAVLPPLVAIVTAIVTRKVYFSLGLGIVTGTIVWAEGNVFRVPIVFADWLLRGVGNNVQVILFTLLLGALIALMQQSGGMKGFANWAIHKADSPRKAQGMGWFLGTFIVFIDDYFDTITVGTVMRPITDRQQVSREKLSYIVDTTAAPIAILAPVSTWVGVIVGNIATQQQHLTESAFSTFLRTIPINFYAIGAVLVALVIILTRLDYGPMKVAEERAASTGQLLRPGATPLQATEMDALGENTDAPPKMANLILPILVLVLVAVIAIWGIGRQSLVAQGIANPGILDSIRAENGDPLQALVIASFVSVVFAGAYYGYQKVISLDRFFTAMEVGFRAMLPAIIVLSLAWTIGVAISDLGLGDTMATLVSDNLSFTVIPALIFLLAAITAFATGTSFGTFAIIIPLAIPIAAAIDPVLIPVLVSATIGGAVFGDHASPISDTTVLSSMASACDHVDHVRTQLPYAGMAAILAILGYLTYGILVTAGTGQVLAAGAAWILMLGILALFFVTLGVRRAWARDEATTAAADDAA